MQPCLPHHTKRQKLCLSTRQQELFDYVSRTRQLSLTETNVHDVQVIHSALNNPTNPPRARVLQFYQLHHHDEFIRKIVGAKFPHAEEIWLQNCTIQCPQTMEALSEFLQNTTAIKSVHFDGFKVSCDESFQYIGQALAVNPSLTTLRLSNMKLSPIMLQSLNQALNQNDILTKLWMHRVKFLDRNSLDTTLENVVNHTTEIRWYPVPNDHIRALARALDTAALTSRLRHLEVGSSARSLVCLFKALQQSKSVDHFELSGFSYLCDNQVEALAGMLNNNTVINGLFLRVCSGGNDADDDVMMEGTNLRTNIRPMFHALAHNDALHTLQLSHIVLCDNDIKVLADALQKNTSLRELTVASANISNAGTKYLSRALRRNQSLTSLHLGDNSGITAIGLIELSKVLRINTGLQYLDVGNDLASNEVAVQAITQALQYNISLHDLACDGGNGPDELERIMSMETRTSMRGKQTSPTILGLL